jgi:hypothetical protein
MRETTKQTIDRLIREKGCSLYGYGDAAHRGATYEQVLATYRPGDDFAQCWRRAYNAVVARERYDRQRRREVPYNQYK